MDGDTGGENLKFEEYYVDVQDTRLKEVSYECEEDEDKLFYCERAIKVHCKRKVECDSGGIVLKTVASDMKWEYKYPILTVGTIADNYWGGACEKYVRETSFEVKNLSAISEFKIIEVGFDDYMRVTVNDVQVYIGPNSGHKLDVLKELREGMFGFKMWSYRVDTGAGIHVCERSTDWGFNVDIDIRPYLKEGVNKIGTEVVVYGGGEGYIKIKSKQHCCSEWEEKWEDVGSCPIH